MNEVNKAVDKLEVLGRRVLGNDILKVDIYNEIKSVIKILRKEHGRN